MGIHRVDFNEYGLVIEVADIEWQRCVVHPEASFIRALENKQHAVVFGEFLAVHQAFAMLTWVIGDLDVDLLFADANGVPGASQLVGLLCVAFVATRNKEESA